MNKLERKYLAHYIDVGMNGAYTNYVRIGKDLEEYREELNPQVDVQRNIRGKPYATIGGFQAQSEAEYYYAYQGDVLFGVLSNIANNRLTDDSCRTTKVDVLVDKYGVQIWAYKEDCIIVPLSVGGDTTGVQIPFNVVCVGNRVYGTFNFSTMTFTEEGEQPTEGMISPLHVHYDGTYTAPSGRGYSPVVVDIEPGTITSLSVTENGTYDAPLGVTYNRVSVSVMTFEEKSANFVDYDGTLLYSFSASEVASMSALPQNPSHTGLIAQGWNATLADIKSFVASNPNIPIYVGQLYRPSDYKTRIIISVGDLKSIYLALRVNGTISVDWGDGTSVSSVTGTSSSTDVLTPHTYSTEGEYTIAITTNANNFAYLGSSMGPCIRGVPSATNVVQEYAYAAMVKEVRIGNMLSVDGNAFRGCENLISVSIPSGLVLMGDYSFYGCRQLKYVAVPRGAVIGKYAFQSTDIKYLLTNQIIGDYSFRYCRSLVSAVLLGNGTSIPQYAFDSCDNLEYVAIPSSVTTIGQRAFEYCYKLKKFTWPNSLTTVGTYAFNQCYLLEQWGLPRSVNLQTGSYSFAYCGFSEVELPSGTTQLGNYLFDGCYVMRSVTIPSSVTLIGNYAFEWCASLTEVHMLGTTPPSFNATMESSVFSNVSPVSFTIYVPYSANHSVLNSYKSNWQTYASHIVEEPQ